MSVGPSDSDGPGPGPAVFTYAMAAAFRTAVRDRFAATLIRTTRESAGLSQRALAARAGTSQPAVSRYESGASSPSVATLDRLLAVMGARLGLFTEGPPRRLDVRTPRMLKLPENRARICGAAHRRGPTNVRVFGSVARGQDRPDSDLDLLVDLDVRSRGLFPLARLRDELVVLLGERVDVVRQDVLAPLVAKNALAEAVPL
jgi:predicted nucleotidyltransferase/DNA-binding XRE family transcriptional regulator